MSKKFKNYLIRYLKTKCNALIGYKCIKGTCSSQDTPISVIKDNVEVIGDGLWFNQISIHENRLSILLVIVFQLYCVRTTRFWNRVCDIGYIYRFIRHTSKNEERVRWRIKKSSALDRPRLDDGSRRWDDFNESVRSFE